MLPASTFLLHLREGKAAKQPLVWLQLSTLQGQDRNRHRIEESAALDALAAASDELENPQHLSCSELDDEGISELLNSYIASNQAEAKDKDQ